MLAIGINDYPDKRLKLDCAAPDARALHQSFLDQQPTAVPLRRGPAAARRQATRANILEGLQWLSSSAKAGDMAVVFYAGHGDNKIEGQFYLVPVDANLATWADAASPATPRRRPSATCLARPC